MIYLTGELNAIQGITGIMKMENFQAGLKYFHFQDSKIQNIDNGVVMVTDGINNTIYTDKDLEKTTMFINNEYQFLFHIKG